MIEILFRLGLALLLSLGLAVLLAWGWSSSDERTAALADSQPAIPAKSAPSR